MSGRKTAMELFMRTSDADNERVVVCSCQKLVDWFNTLPDGDTSGRY